MKTIILIITTFIVTFINTFTKSTSTSMSSNVFNSIFSSLTDDKKGPYTVVFSESPNLNVFRKNDLQN